MGNFFITIPSETGFSSLDSIDKRIESMLINDEPAVTLGKKSPTIDRRTRRGTDGSQGDHHEEGGKG